MGFVRGKTSGGPTNVTARKMTTAGGGPRAGGTSAALGEPTGRASIDGSRLDVNREQDPNSFEQVGGFLFGSGQDPGLFGTGRREVQRHEVDPNAARIPGAEGFASQLAAGATAAGQRAAPTIGESSFRGGQEGLVAALTAQANGQGPSLAQGQLRQATDRNLAQAIAMAQTVGGSNPGAIRNLANQRAAISQQAAGDSSQLALQEQMQARNQLGQALAGARGQDIALGSENARLGQQQTALNDNLTQFYLSQGLNLAQAQQQAAMQLEQLRLSGALGFEGLENEAFQASAGARQQFGQNLVRGIAGLTGLGAGA